MSQAAALEPKVLDLGLHFNFGPAPDRKRLRWALVPVALAAAAVVAGTIAQPYFQSASNTPAVVRIPLAQQQFIASLNVDDKAELLVLGADAQARNAAIPLSGSPIEQVKGFLGTQAGETPYRTALQCLTQAVYYEAAVEPLQGRRAVAQVVLNRMRHPAYPHSVCGVVYQGSQRRTGCQFSFTCDGSLLRPPSVGPWREAEAIARAALAGQVEPSVGTATHYHADYVLPKWAFQLGKIDQIGRHIFYRFNGGWGKAAALSQRYSGNEAIPALNFAALRVRLEDQGKSVAPTDEFVPGLTVTRDASDRHAENDVGGRLDTTKEWRLTIPDPVQASSRYRAALGDAAPAQATGTTPAAAAAVAIPPAPPAAAGHEVAVR